MVIYPFRRYWSAMARRLTTPQLIGRQHELAVLHNALADVAAGDGARLALIEGDAGIGKTRLVEAFISAKTASVHVSNILRKLGLKRRMQVMGIDADGVTPRT
jgi:ATP/maltotriose-dependent transcriptional regulator MalT